MKDNIDILLTRKENGYVYRVLTKKGKKIYDLFDFYRDDMCDIDVSFQFYPTFCSILREYGLTMYIEGE